MEYAMVTARMSKRKKEAVQKALRKLGTNPSSAINALFDYVLAENALPFADEQTNSGNEISPAKMNEAKAWLESIPQLSISKKFANIEDKELRWERIKQRNGLQDS